jgi:hypothetical protein
MDEAQDHPGSGRPNGADEVATEAVDHLRAAAHELIGAVRGFLDVAEELVDDPNAGQAVVDTVTTLAEAARRGARSVVRDAGRARPDDAYEHIDLAD